MATKYVGVRLEEELLKLKPENMTLSDWIRECIHVWKICKNGDLKKLIKELEEIKETGKTLMNCPNLDRLSEVAEEIEEATKKLKEFKELVESIEYYTEMIEKVKEKIEDKLVYHARLYERDYSNV